MADKQLEIIVRARDLLSRGLDRIQSRITRFSHTITENFRRATRAVFSLRGALLGLGVVAIGRQIIDAASKIEQFRVQLTALVGDAEQAEGLLLRMREFAAASPLMTEDVIQAFVRLKSVGVSNAEEVIKTLGNTALIFTRQVTDVAEAFVSVETEVLRRFGIEVERTAERAVLKAGEGVNKIRIITENNAEAIRKAVLHIWEDRFINAMDLAADTFAAKMAVMKSAFDDLFADIGETILPLFKRIIDSVTSFVNQNRDLIVSTLKSIPEIWAETITFIRQKTEEQFGRGFLGNERVIEAFQAVTRLILRMFGNMLLGMMDLVGAVAQQIWKPLVIAFVAAENSILQSYANLFDFITRRTLDLGEKVRKLNEKNFGFVADKLRIDLSEAIDEIAAKSDQMTKQFQQDIADIGQAGNRLADSFDLDDLQKRISAIVQRTKQGIIEIREEQKKLQREAASNAEDEALSPFRQASKDFLEGWKEAIDEVLKRLQNWKEQGKRAANELANGLTNSFQGFFDSIIDGTEKVDEAFEKMGKNILRTVQQILTRIAAEQLVAILIRGLGTIGGSIPNPLGGGVPTPSPAGIPSGGVSFFAARGGVFQKGLQGTMSLRRFQHGGIAEQPTLGIFGEGNKAEAFVPLPDGRRIPVKLTQEGINQPTVVLNMIIKAWDAEDVFRNRQTLAAAMIDQLKRGGPFRDAIRRA